MAYSLERFAKNMGQAAKREEQGKRQEKKKKGILLIACKIFTIKLEVQLIKFNNIWKPQ